MNFFYKKSFTLSVLIHIAVILIFIFKIIAVENTTSLTMPAEKKALQAYVIQTKKNQTEHPTEKIQHEKIKKNILLKSSEATKKLEKTEVESTKTSTVSTSNATKPVDKFLQILHNTIQEHQIYPRQAKIMQQKGTALVKFNLFPDGHIENIVLVESSKVASLDAAALAAVQDAAPIKDARLYLTAMQTFTVHVDFL